MNPFNGKFTDKTLNRAAHMIQSMGRTHRLRLHRLTTEEFSRAVQLEMSAAAAYKSVQKRLAVVVNYALVSHAVKLDENLARDLYEQAYNMSDTNPLTLRAYGIFLLSTCDSPIKVTREKALFMIRDGRVRDTEHLKFNTAFTLCFKYGCYRKPNDYRVYLNLGLAAFYIYEDLPLAEKAFRRAVAMAPFEERNLENWKLVREKFPEKQNLFHPMSKIQLVNTNTGSQKKLIHGRWVREDPAWAGWAYYEAEEETEWNMKKGTLNLNY